VASAAAVTRTEAIATYDVSTVLMTVTSHVALRPARREDDVNPSGRSQSDLVNPCDSLTNEMPMIMIVNDC